MATSECRYFLMGTTYYTVYTVIFEGCKFRGRQVRKDFRGLIFVDHQVEYIVLP